MQTETQSASIRNYLLQKKLPIDILLEVQDHFDCQIMQLQKEDHLNFEEAFERTKSTWAKELRP